MIIPLKPALWIGGAVGVLLAAAVITQHFTGPSGAKVAADVAKSVRVEQAYATQTVASAKVDTFEQKVHTLERQLAAVAAAGRRASDTVGQRAITLRDSSAMYHLRWQLLGVAYDSLGEAKRLADLRADSLGRNGIRWKFVADSAVDVNKQLRLDLKKDCRIIPFVSCPSRKAVLIIGLVAGATAVYLAENPAKAKNAIHLGGILKF